MDAREFERLWQEALPSVRRLLDRMIHSREMREDAEQDVALKAYRGWARFKGDSSFGTWVYGIAVRVALDAIRAASRRPVCLDLYGRPLDGSHVHAESCATLEETLPGRGADAGAIVDGLLMDEALRLAEARSPLMVGTALGLEIDARALGETAREVGITDRSLADRGWKGRREIREAAREVGV